MANSAFNLSSAIGADGRSIRAIKVQDGHGFSAGSVVRYAQNLAGETGDFQLAQADSVVNAEVVGIVESVDANQFTIVYQGEMNTASMWWGNPGAFADLSLSDVWFLDATVAGGLTATAPLGAGNVVKPILTMVSGTDDDIGIVTNYIGTVVGGENTVSLDTVHPVGEVVPWGGETYNIPDGWQLCDGATVDTGAYPDYYTRVGTKFGYWATCDLTFTASSSVTAGMIPGNSASEDLGEAARTLSSIITYTEGDTESGTILLDPDYLVNAFQPGGETAGEIAPHGQVFTTGTLNITSNDEDVTVASVTVTSVKTPDLRARHVITATDSFGTFDGYTAGQIGGKEDANKTVLYASDDDGNGAYTLYYGPAAQGEPTLRSPYMALHHIIRIDSMSKAALVGDVSVDDDGLTDHDTPLPTEGDILLYGGGFDGDGNNRYRNIKVFGGYPSDTSGVENFESSFRIKTSSAGDVGAGAIAIGHVVHADADLDIMRGGKSQIKLRRTNSDGVGNVNLVLFTDSGGAYMQTIGDRRLYLGTNGLQNDVGTPSIIIHGTDYAQKVQIQKNFQVDGSSQLSGNVETINNLKVGGQAYSEADIHTSSGTKTMDCDDGNVLVWTRSNSSFTLTDVTNHKAGGSYTIIMRNTGATNRTFTLTSDTGDGPLAAEKCKFANNIIPSMVLAGQQVIISMVSDGTTLYCTFADFNA